VCCGLTWISTGQLGTAKRVLARTLRTLKPWLAAGVPVVGLEPSCTAVLRAEATELLPDNPASRQLSGAVRTLAEVLQPHLAELTAATGGEDGTTSEAEPSGPQRPSQPRQAIAQVHCHQYADLGYDADREVLAALGVRTEVLDSGCCGLAGNFGFERGHYEISQACAERVLYPAVRAAASGVQVIADGYSCRTQIRQGTGARPVHLAQLAADAVRQTQQAERPAGD
jgi:Fe-S oxidoreductase